MISTLDDLHIWAPALATGTLLQPATQAQRLETVNAPGLASDVGYGLGIFDVAGWIGHNGSLPPGYQTVCVYLPEQETTLAIMINTDVPPYQAANPARRWRGPSRRSSRRNTSTSSAPECRIRTRRPRPRRRLGDPGNVLDVRPADQLTPCEWQSVREHTSPLTCPPAAVACRA